MEINAVLLDVAAIQQYVFGSNKLKENLGASYLVEKIFEKNLKTAFENTCLQCDISDWKRTTRVKICDPDVEVEIGYIGGGNALLFFKDNDHAVKLAKEWTKILLIETPGLVPSIAIKKMECSALSDKNRFQLETGELFRMLRENKNEYQPQTILPRHGITAECSHTGLSAECYDEKDKVYISSVAMSKKCRADDANTELHNKFSDILEDKIFPMELDELGQQEGDNHISIVHIDGNNMGMKFRSCKTLKEIRDLSKSVRVATENSFKFLLEHIVKNYNHFYEKLNLAKNTLPIRPIIMGGDDITFISHGKLGIYFAKIFMEQFTREKVSGKNYLSACAGVAVTGTKYPFYRGYQLSEDLCKQAKKKAHEEDKLNSSWLDFHIAYGGFSGSIEDIRKNNYTTPRGDLCLRPYRVTGKCEDHLNFNDCLSGIKYLIGNELDNEWPRSKLKELREVLTLQTPAVRMFIKEMEFRGRSLPDIAGYKDAKNTGWIEQTTPYFDMLELMEFYPVKYINSGRGD